MKRLALAAAFVLAVIPAASAQFSPGTVVGNVYQNPISGYGYGFGYPGTPGTVYYWYPPAYHQIHKKPRHPAGTAEH